MEDDATAAAAAAAADALSKVLGDDDLLAEILLRVGFPTTLVRAASVCKRWLHHASDKAFLRRFRKRNPPRLLGFYVEGQGSPRFVPVLPQPPELAAAVRIAGGYSFGVGNYRVLPLHCRNGSVFTVPRSSRSGFRFSFGLHSPLCPERAMAIDPPLSLYHQPRYHDTDNFRILSKEEKDGRLSYFYVVRENPWNEDTTSPTNLTACVCMLKDGVWCMYTSAKTKIPYWRAGFRAVLVDNKIYMLATLIDITVLDLTTSSFSTIQLPQGVTDFMLSRADDASSVYLIGLNEHQVSIWLYKEDSWLIVDTVCFHELWANLMMSDSRFKDVPTSRVWINHVGDNAEFVLLQMGPVVLYLDVRCRTLRRLYEMPQDEPFMGSISIQPFMMIRSPTFPALKCDPTRNAT